MRFFHTAGSGLLFVPILFAASVATLPVWLSGSAPSISIDEGVERQKARTRIAEAQEFHQRAIVPPGLLIPLYIYPKDIHTNADFNRVIELKRKYSTVPFWVIVNPASGPGASLDDNYRKAIDRLVGSGCVVLGYVATSYAKRSVSDVAKDLDTWQSTYPRVHGIFFDEMVYDDNEETCKFQSRLKEQASDRGYWPVVANPGTDTPERYLKSNVADVIVTHESGSWPAESKLHGNYFGGYSDYPPFTRAALVYGQNGIDAEKIRMITQYSRWLYVTQDTYQPNDANHPNPWDQLSVHLEDICRILTEQSR